MKDTPFSHMPRLQLCASFLPRGIRLCDVGTDHAYLPVALALQGAVVSALACDIREGPLRSAQAHIAAYAVADRVKTRLSDGLRAVDAEEVDAVVLAGMGGELIARIIGETAWLRDPQKFLVVQPMSKAPALRESLAQNGFALEREEAVFDAGRPYTVMAYRFAPDRALTDAAHIWFGLLQPCTPPARAYLQRVQRDLQRRIHGILCEHGDPSAFQALSDRLASALQTP